MTTREEGQIVVIVAVAMMVILLILALIIDGARLMVEGQELNRAADAAGKAGLIIVGDRMVTQVVAAQTASASITVLPTATGSTPGPTLTPTPDSDDFYSWMDDGDRSTLVSPPMQTLVATHVLGSAEENGLGFNNPVVTSLEISYPDGYHPTDQDIQIQVRIERTVAVIFGKILNFNQGVLSGLTRQKIPQR